MHILQPKHSKLKPEETDRLLSSLNISKTQLPKINSEDPALPENSQVGDVIKIERENNGKKTVYFRIVV